MIRFPRYPRLHARLPWHVALIMTCCIVMWWVVLAELWLAFALLYVVFVLPFRAFTRSSRKRSLR